MATISSRTPAGREIPRRGGVGGPDFGLLGSGPGPTSGVEAGTMGAGVMGEGGSTVSPGTGPSLDLTVCREAGPHDEPREPTWGERPPPVGLCAFTSGVRGIDTPRAPAEEGATPPPGTPSGRPRIPRIWAATSPPSRGAPGEGTVPVGPPPESEAADMCPPPAPDDCPVELSTLPRKALSPWAPGDGCGHVSAADPRVLSPSTTTLLLLLPLPATVRTGSAGRSGAGRWTVPLINLRTGVMRGG